MKIWSFILLLTIGLSANSLETKMDECQNGNMVSCCDVGIELTTGENAEIQDKKYLGIDYLRQACRHDQFKACDALGSNYYQNKHYTAAMPYLNDSCKRDNLDACESLGTIYRDGHETRADDVKSRKYYEQACRLGSKDACIAVAIIYRGGFGVEKSRAKEKEYYKKACDVGSQPGCDSFTKLDNEDKGIKPEGFVDKLLKFFN